jgi:hypothetical protein
LGELNQWYAVEFDFNHLCWVEICWIENLEIGGHWQAFCIAREDLGLDITLQDATDQDQLDCTRRPRDTVDETPTMHTSTLSTIAKQALFKFDHQHHKEEAIKLLHYN